MKSVYFDEKGPQGSFSASKNPSELPFKHGSDKMKSFILSGFCIPEKYINDFSSELRQIIEKYIQDAGRKLNLNSEIKGHQLFRKIDYGIASISYQQYHLIRDIESLFDKYDCENLTVSTNKYSMVINSKLGNWILALRKSHPGISTSRLKFSLNKYLEESASEKSVKILLDPDSSVVDVLKQIKSDILMINTLNTPYKYRVRSENFSFLKSAINQYLKKYSHLPLPSKDSNKFKWDRVSFLVSLWFKDQHFREPDNCHTIFTDQGIPDTIFTDLPCLDNKVSSEIIKSNLDSSQYAGIQMADIIASLTGKLLSNIVQNAKPRNNNTAELKFIPEEFYNLQEHQYNSAEIIYKILFTGSSIYNFSYDYTSSDELILKSYLEEIVSYNSYEEYKKIPPRSHARKHYRRYEEIQKDVLDDADINLMIVEELEGSLQIAIKNNLIAPI